MVCYPMFIRSTCVDLLPLLLNCNSGTAAISHGSIYTYRLGLFYDLVYHVNIVCLKSIKHLASLASVIFPIPSRNNIF